MSHDGQHPPGWSPAGLLPWPVPGVAGLLISVDLLIISDFVAPLRAAIVLPVVLVLPGWLTLLALGERRLRGPQRLLHALAASVLQLMVLGLLMSLLPHGGLSTTTCLIGFNVLIALLLGPASHAGAKRGWRRSPRLSVARVGVLACAFACTSVALAIVGAVRLNRGGGPSIAIAGYVLVIITLATSVAAGRRGESLGLLALSVYGAGLAVLLATSLRGAAVTGHDVRIEYRVFQDTLRALKWQSGGKFSDYNSCLSITILPTMLTRLLRIDPVDTFRICFQLIFAAVPVGVLLLARRLLPVGPAVVAAGLFIAFPTYVNDMPMLNRQEIALLFFVVALQGLFAPSIRPRLELLAMTAGVILSHYSTAYATLALLVLTAALLRLARVQRGPLQFPVLAVGLLMAACWGATTGSASALVETAQGTYSSLTSAGFGQSGGTNQGDSASLADYLVKHRYPGAPVSRPPAGLNCEPRVLPPDVLPLTAVGRKLQSVGLRPGNVTLVFRTVAAEVFITGAVAGVGLLLRRRRVGHAGKLFLRMGVASLILVAGIVGVPGLSAVYGVLRVYQQLLVVLAPVVVVALGWILRSLRRLRAVMVLMVVMGGCLVVTSGVLPLSLGGYEPQLGLANAGPYYRAYYATAADTQLARWVDARLPATAVVAADTAITGELRSSTRLYPLEGLAPSITPADSYLALRTEGDFVDAVAVVDNRVLRYAFPLSCIANGRPLLYDDGKRRVYGPGR